VRCCAVIDIDLVGTFNASRCVHACAAFDFDRELNTTVGRAAYEALKASKAGVIINISATLHHGATPWQLHASSAKAAIDALTRNLGAPPSSLAAIAPVLTTTTPLLQGWSGVPTASGRWALRPVPSRAPRD
jgi:NAD(P)-dependent dehydrogenase (short-subunit alcohol dehydrogenase family)